jgi:hypothetical protein
LFFRPVEVQTACDLNRLWHSRLPVLKKSNVLRTVHSVCYVAEYKGLFYATAVWTNPIARLLPQDTWLELRRLAIAPDAPKNTASRMLGWMVRDIRKRLPKIRVLVSYQDTEVHSGTIYRAAGWIATSRAANDWVRPNRQRVPSQSAAVKQRWEKHLSAIPVNVRAEGESER